MSLKVYVAAPFARRAEVRIVHEKMRALGLEPTSQWAYGTENEAELSVREARALADRNDADVLRSHALLMMAYPGEGGESFCEARLAIEYRVPIVWIGRRVLSTLRPGVVQAPALDEALATLARWAAAVRRPYPCDASWVRSVIRDELAKSAFDGATAQKGAA